MAEIPYRIECEPSQRGTCGYITVTFSDGSTEAQLSFASSTDFEEFVALNVTALLDIKIGEAHRADTN